MNLEYVNSEIISPAMRLLGTARNYDTPAARTMLLTIGQQESRFLYRAQVPSKIARGFWQFEKGGGVKGVLTHVSSASEMARVLNLIHVARDDVYQAIEYHDALAAVCARLLLYTDPRPLPTVSDAEGAWQLYSRVWRPGKPHRETWDAYHTKARQVVKA